MNSLLRGQCLCYVLEIVGLVKRERDDFMFLLVFCTFILLYEGYFPDEFYADKVKAIISC